MFRILIIACLYLCSCSSESGDNLYKSEIEVNPKSEEVIKLSEFVDDVKYVELEFSNESIIKRISAVYYSNGKYIIADRGTHTIFIFSDKGKFLSKFNRKGRANYEYLSLDNVMFDEQKEQIIVYDFNRRNLLYYTLSGECVATLNISAKCTRSFQDIINLPNGNFLCYEFMHGTQQSNYDGIWEMKPDGEIVRWLHRNELVHPCSSPVYAMAYDPQGKIFIMNMEDNADMEYDDKLAYGVKYNMQGKTAKDFSGLNNSDYAPKWSQGEMFNTRRWAVKVGEYIFSKWSGEQRGEVYYTLCNEQNGQVTCGRDVDYLSCKGAQALPSVVLNGKDAIEIIPSNLKGSVVVPLYVESLMSEKYASQSKTLLAGRDIDDMNPILQIWTVRY